MVVDTLGGRVQVKWAMEAAATPSAQLLGMNKIVSEDALRRALARMSHAQSSAWLCPHFVRCCWRGNCFF
ncbi:MAG: hypothetical protein QM533_04430 [Cytophagales bacterium]|nr:hypothetical protein [Cytophagales bacterium]